MKRVQIHRGPDDEGDILYPQLGFAHTRLSIIDLNRGHQPITKYKSGNAYTIIYNGELYNTSELRDNLIRMGYLFKTQTDTEVILTGYMAFGADFVKELLYPAVDARDLPNMADVESSLLYFCQKVASKTKVALTGECADEIFGGYPWFHDPDIMSINTFPWSKNMETRKLLLSRDLLSSVDFDGYVQAAYEKSIAETPILAGESKSEARRREIAYLNLKWFMVTLLDRMDRCSMYSGLEARVPLADHRIVEYIWNVPWEMKCPKGIVKGLLREAGKGLLPDEILYRRKSPYPKTYHPEYEKLLGNRLLDILSDTNAPIRPLVDGKKIKTFLSSPSDYGKPWYGQLMAGPQMIAYLLQINYWLEKYKVELV